MSKEDEKAEWKRRQGIKIPKPQVLHQSKMFWPVKTDTLPKLVPGPGRTFVGPEATQKRIDQQLAKQRLRDLRMIEEANRSIDAMRSVSEGAELLGTSVHPADTQ